MKATKASRSTAARCASTAAVLIGAVVSAAAPAQATQYPARSETGWVHTSKRECCNDAIARAQDASAVACENAGGSPAPLRGGVQRRGSCAWEATTDEASVTVYRCRAEAAAGCR